MSIQQAIAENLADIVSQAGAQKIASPGGSSQEKESTRSSSASAELLLSTQHELILQFELRIANLTQQSQELEMDIELLNSQLHTLPADVGQECLELNSQQWMNKAKSLDNQVETLKADLESKHFLRFNDQTFNIDLATQWEELQIHQQNLANSLERFGNSKLLPPQLISQMLELEMAKVQLRSDYLAAQEELAQATHSAIDSIALKNYQAAKIDCGRLRDMYSQRTHLLLDQYRDASVPSISKKSDTSVELCSKQDLILNQRLTEQMENLEKLGQLLISNIKKRLPREREFVSTVERDIQLVGRILAQLRFWSQSCSTEDANLDRVLRHQKENTKVSILLSSMMVGNLTPVDRWFNLLNQIASKQGLKEETQNWLSATLNTIQQNLQPGRQELLETVRLLQLSQASWSELEQNTARLQQSKRSQSQQLEQRCSDNLAQFLRDRSQLLNTFRFNSENEIKRMQQRFEECQRRNNDNLDSRLRELAGSQQTLLYHLNDQAPVPGGQVSGTLLQNRTAEFQRFAKLFQELQFTNESMFRLNSQQNRLKKYQQRIRKMKSEFENLSQLAKNNLDVMDCRLASSGSQVDAKTTLSASKPFVNVAIEIDGIQSIDTKLEGVDLVQIILEIASQRKSVILPIDDDSSGPAVKLLFNRVLRTNSLILIIESDNQLQKRVYGRYEISLSEIEEDQTWVEFPFSSLSNTTENLLEPVLRLKLQ